MKKLALILFVFSLSLTIAQKSVDLESVIPSDASMVVRINGGELTKKVGMKNISKSEAFLKLLEGEIFLGNDKKRVTEIGVNLEKDVYMFYRSNENMTYTAYLYYIEKPKLFASYISEKNDFVETKKGKDYTAIFYKSTSYYNDVQDFLAWNKNYAIYVDVNYVRDRPLKVEEEESVIIETELIDAQVEEAADAVKEATDNSVDYYQEREAQRIARQKTRDSLREVERLQKLEIVRGVYDQELESFFGGKVGANSISKNENYTKSKKANSDVGVWMNLRGTSLLSRSMYNYGYYGRRNDFPGMMSMFLGAYAGKDFNANLFFNSSDITIESNIEFMPKISSLLEGIYGTSIPKGYLKYISTEKVLGISSVSMNSAKFWEAFPKVYAEAAMLSMYSRPDEKEREGIRVLVDFISIMMDEEALSKLVTGNAVFVLKDLVPKEVEYYSYEYNEDYSESKRVKKTRIETRPDFLLMFGSKNKEFMTKLLDLACKNEVLFKNGNYYFTDGESRDFPFALYFTLTDDMAFVSTSKTEIKDLADGKSIGNLDKKMAANVLKNSSYFHLHLPDLLSKIREEDMTRNEAKMLTYFKDNGGEIEWFNNFSENKSIGKMSMNTPSKFKNSALFIWDFIETAHEIEEEARKEREARSKAREEKYKNEQPANAAEDVEAPVEMKCETGKCDGGH
ncbi:MAG: DUF4836 family protein [Crocinitomicaceae bacterium]